MQAYVFSPKNYPEIAGALILAGHTLSEVSFGEMLFAGYRLLVENMDQEQREKLDAELEPEVKGKELRARVLSQFMPTKK